MRLLLQRVPEDNFDDTYSDVDVVVVVDVAVVDVVVVVDDGALATEDFSI